MFLLRLWLGFLFIILGLGYLFDPKTILRINQFMRDTVFSDPRVLLRGKKIGSLLLFIGFLLLILSFRTPR